MVWAELGDCQRFRRVAAGGPPHRPGRDRGPVRPSPRAVTCPPGTRDVALGPVRGPMAASRTTSPDRDYYQAVKKPTTAKSPAFRGPQAGPACYHTLRPLDPNVVYSTPGKLAHIPVGPDGLADRPSQTSGPPRSAPVFGLPASTRAGRPYNNDAAAALVSTGGHPIRIVSPTTPRSSCTSRKRWAPLPPSPADQKSSPTRGPSAPSRKKQP